MGVLWSEGAWYVRNAFSLSVDVVVYFAYFVVISL